MHELINHASIFKIANKNSSSYRPGLKPHVLQIVRSNVSRAKQNDEHDWKNEVAEITVKPPEKSSSW